MRLLIFQNLFLKFDRSVAIWCLVKHISHTNFVQFYKVPTWQVRTLYQTRSLFSWICNVDLWLITRFASKICCDLVSRGISYTKGNSPIKDPGERKISSNQCRLYVPIERSGLPTIRWLEIHLNDSHIHYC